jgi:hypothetical protein
MAKPDETPPGACDRLASERAKAVMVSSTFFILSSIRKFFTLGYGTFYALLRKKVAVLQLVH